MNVMGLQYKGAIAPTAMSTGRMNFLNGHVPVTNDAQRGWALGKWAALPAPSRAALCQRNTKRLD